MLFWPAAYADVRLPDYVQRRQTGARYRFALPSLLVRASPRFCRRWKIEFHFGLCIAVKATNIFSTMWNCIQALQYSPSSLLNTAGAPQDTQGRPAEQVAGRE